MQANKCKELLLILTFLPIILLAQQNTVSPYSAFGIGEPQSQGFSLNSALGGVGVAMRGGNFLNPINPASLSAITNTTFETGLSGTSIFLRDKTLSREAFVSSLAYLSLGFPISKGFAVSGGLSPYSFKGFDLSQNFTFTDQEDTLNYTINHNGSGGLNRAYTNFGIELDGFSFGATASMIFGTLNQKRDLVFNDSQELWRRDESAYNVRDLTYDFGFQYQTNVSDKQLTIGATYSPETTLNANKKETTYTFDIINGLELIRDTVEAFASTTNKLLLPKSYAIGFALQKETEWFISAEIDFKEWSQMTLFDAQDPNIKDATQFRLGAWWIPNNQDVHNYLNVIQYRAGFNYNTGHISTTVFGVSGTPTEINDISISFGLGLPMKRSKTSTNISIQLGKRGSVNNGLVEERYLRFVAAFTFNDKWFKKRKID